MVRRVVADVARAVLLFDAADAMHQRLGARDRPRTGEIVVADIGPVDLAPLAVDTVEFACELDVDRRKGVDVGQLPRLGAVGEIAVAQEHHRGAVLERDAHGLDRCIEAVSGRTRGDDRHRRLPVAAVHRHHQIGRLGFGGQTGGRAAALDVDHDQRKLKAHGEPEGFALERNTRATGGRDADMAAIARAEGGADGGDLVFGLEGPDAEVLVLRQLVKDVARRRDRIRAEEQREAGLLACGDQTPTQGGVAVDVRVRAGRELRRANRHPAGRKLSSFAKGIPCPVRRFVRGDHQVAALELLLDPQHGRLFGPGIQPGHEP